MSLKPWREVVTPHPDVAAGRYRQAEFAADLAQVLSGKVEAEYQDPDVDAETTRRLRSSRNRGDFRAVHVCPTSSADVPDEQEVRYQGLSLGSSSSTIYFDDPSVFVKPEVAQQQFDTNTQTTAPLTTHSQSDLSGDAKKVANGGTPALAATATSPVTSRPTARRFHGVVKLDETRIAHDAGHIAEEIIQHLTGQLGPNVEITLEIQAQLPNGAAENVVRTVFENARTLKFKGFGFEEE